MNSVFFQCLLRQWWCGIFGVFLRLVFGFQNISKTICCLSSDQLLVRANICDERQVFMSVLGCGFFLTRKTRGVGGLGLDPTWGGGPEPEAPVCVSAQSAENFLGYVLRWCPIFFGRVIPRRGSLATGWGDPPGSQQEACSVDISPSCASQG